MKKVMILLVLCLTVLVSMAGVSWSEEGAWYDAAENWIVRVYSAPSGADYSVTLEVLDLGNTLVTDPIIGMPTNPLLITGAAGGPDVSIAFDEATATAYLLYTAGGGGVALQAVPDIARVRMGVLDAAPNPVLFGSVLLGASSYKTVTVSNIGDAPLTITSIGTPAQPFSIVTSKTTCSAGTALAPGVSCTITLKFAPPAAIPYNTSFTIGSDVGDVTVNLSGTGVLRGTIIY